jgi:iron complex transport system ATP-binding protein
MVSGFLSLYATDKNEFIGYDLYDLKQGTQLPFIRTTGEKHWQRIGAYSFIPESLEHAQNIILHAGEADLCVVDEVGPLELEGKGLWPALKNVIYLPSPDFILVVRDTILGNWLGTLEHARVKIFDTSDKELYPKMIQYFSAKDVYSNKS